MSINILQILKLAIEKNASDIHITVDSPPMLRVDGHLCKVNAPALNSKQTKELCYAIVSDEQKAKFESEKNLDFSFFVKNLARFRGSLFFQKGSVAATLRTLRFSPYSLDEINVPSAIHEIADFPNGLVLITGPTGSGKSTTLSALIDHINQTRHAHILTIEDPIEIIHEHKNCIVNQREVGLDCRGFYEGLKSAMRSDPDICLIGEMRDTDTIEATLKLAETGHLVLSTLHTNTAAKSIDRIIGNFSVDNRDQILNQLSTVLQAVVSQKLVESLHGGRVVVAEILMATPAVRNLIRENKIYQIYNIMQTSADLGMLTLNNHLVSLIQKNIISQKEAFRVSPERDELYKLLKSKDLINRQANPKKLLKTKAG